MRQKQKQKKRRENLFPPFFEMGAKNGDVS
jgi:hypothetical protein